MRSPPRHDPLPRSWWATSLLVAAVLVGLLVAVAEAREYASDEKIGIDEQLGSTIPLDVTFRDENGLSVTLADLVERPTILTLVYFECPSICSPLMHELARTVEKVDLVPGVDYDLVTVSFDDTETHELAREAKKRLLGGMAKKIPPESWRFLTGTAPNITVLTDAVGFRYRKEKELFVHAATVIFLTREGKIVRYLGGLKLLPADVKLALLDAKTGRELSLMQRIQKICYAYDSEAKTYVLDLNQIVLWVTLAGVAIFLGYLLTHELRKRRRRAATEPVRADVVPGRNAG